MVKKYRIINNACGWFVFAIALLTYWLTLEPTASYWDCGEFIIQADKLEVGHPPGNPIFMLTARFFANFAPSAAKISLMVNAMSGLLSALTILLLFWTITHLVKRLVVKDSSAEMSIQQLVAVIGSGLVGSLAYCWSDTFWFSAVEGEVYAFSSFCTALVFWLILKWENHADSPSSDRYLILIAYIIGVSVAVHLLNLLCIPAIVLVFAYRKYPDMNLKKSLLALLISFAIIVLVLYGLVPGFIKVAQWFELMFVNGFHMGFNSGAIAYAVIATATFIWAIYELYSGKSPLRIRLSFFLAVALSGMLFFGNGWALGAILLAALAGWLWFGTRKRLPLRVLNIILWSISVIFTGYSSYALILIRSNANTPMNQNAPDNVFDLASYLNREQYGENPLIYGETLYSGVQKQVDGFRNDTVHIYEDGSALTIATPVYVGQVVNVGKPIYAKGVAGATPKSEYRLLKESDIKSNEKLAARGGDYYVKRDYKPEMKLNPELNMLFPRLYSRQHAALYREWVNLDTMPGQLKTISAVDLQTGEKINELDVQSEPEFNEVAGTLYWPEKRVYKPTFGQNLSYFFNYQLNHMYMRYFMWNFAGRQNDVTNQHGELDAGNWISGIPMIDNARLGDQSLLPDDLGKANKGNNKYYLLPLILGLIGLVWQSFAGKRGIEQFWVIFFLFFMTGIAIVIYLNQTPNQPRERDYAFAGSFYAFAIWIGMGAAALWRILLWFATKKERSTAGNANEANDKASQKNINTEPAQLDSLTNEPKQFGRKSAICAIAGTMFALVVPIQMVSQTWDDHDRSGRYAARDYAVNYLESLEPNAIVFCNGDNDTFPLWYAQEVEGVRPDVKIINLSYLNSDWYANQHRLKSYKAEPVSFTAKPEDYAYGLNDVTLVNSEQQAPADLLSSLKMLYSGKSVDEGYGYRTLPSSIVTIPIDKEIVLKRGLVAPEDADKIVDKITIDLGASSANRQKGYLSLGEILMLDIIATNAAEGWKRPIYWASTVGDDYYLGLSGYMRTVGMNFQLVPTIQEDKAPRTDRGVDVVTGKYRWGGADNDSKSPYFDETARRMLYSTRSSILDLASQCLFEGDRLIDDGDKKAAAAKYRTALQLCDIVLTKLPSRVAPYELSSALTMGEIICKSSEALGNHKAKLKGLSVLYSLLKRDARYLKYSNMAKTTFINPSLTYESSAIIYQYWRIIETYLKYGGSLKSVEKIVRTTGFDLPTLKRLYEHAYGGVDLTDYSASEEEYSAEGVAEDINRICEIANNLAKLSPEEYATSSEDERTYDSLLWAVVELYQNQGGDIRELDALPQFKALDKARSKRLYDEYLANHPDMQ